MSGLPENKMERELYRAVFDAIPSPLLVVNERLEVLECNQAAVGLGGPGAPPAGRQLGAVLGCFQGCEPAEGGGRPEPCCDCVVRAALETAFQGGSVSRQWARLEQLVNGRPTRVSLQVACQPMVYQGQALALLMLEGLNP